MLKVVEHPDQLDINDITYTGFGRIDIIRICMKCRKNRHYSLPNRPKDSMQYFPILSIREYI